MSKENKKSILEEAVIELETILEAADKNAKDKIAKELPEKFESLLNEEIKKIKNKKESVHESAKDKINEPFKGKKGDTDDHKESLQEMNMTEMSIEEVEEAYDEAMDDDLFETIDVNDIAAEIDEMAGIQNEIEEDMQEGNPNDPYAKLKHLYETMTQMMKEMDEAKMDEQLQEEFGTHMSEMYGEDYKDVMGDDTFNELYEMFKSSKSKSNKGNVNESEEMNAQPNQPAGGQQDKIKVLQQKLADAYKWFQENIAAPAASGMREGEDLFENDPVAAGGQAPQGGDKLKTMQQKLADAYKWFQENIAAPAASGMREGEEIELDETAGIGKNHALNRTQGNDKLPSADHKKSTQRAAMKEGESKKLQALIAENKRLTKQVNELNSVKSDLSKTNENYKGVLEKYRNQLQEMAVLNTNIAHVNNLLIKESNLTIDEKKAIVNKFKNVETISEAETVYKSLLSEMNKGKKEQLGEGIEKKITNTIDPSSSKIVAEQVVEKTAYSNDHLKKIKNIMNYELRK